MLKKCYYCGETKDIIFFSKNKARYDGLKNICKKCDVEYSCKNWAYILMIDAKKRSKKKNWEFNITKEYILELFEKQNGMCYWYNVPMIPSITNRFSQKPSLDRLDNNIGYICGNVVLTCYAANAGRGKTTVDRFREFVKLIKRKNEY